VLFAWERYIIIVSPLKRLKLLSVHTTRKIVTSIVLISVFITSYTPLISGLRNLENFELNLRNNKEIRHECDTLQQFKEVYNYIIFSYVIMGIITPIILLFYFNLTIIKVLLTRKKRIFKQKFDQKYYSKMNSLNLTKEPTREPTRDPTKDPAKDLTRNQTSGPTKEPKNLKEIELEETNALDFDAPGITESKRMRQTTVSVSKKSTSFKSTDKVTYMLIMISFFFVGLNLPYISTWLAFFIPFKADLLTLDQIHFRYSLINLSETLHLLNFSIGIVFYIMSSKKVF